MRHSIDGIIRHGQTKQTVFMEPQAVVQINRLLRQVEVAIEEVARICELSDYLGLWGVH
jgi:dsDNA-specific endonuclease/ATPase MutS2